MDINASLCRILLLCHWLSALLCAWIIRAMHNRNGDAVFIQPSANNIPSNPIMQSIDAILLVGGCIICCSVLSGILGKLLAMFPFLQPFTHALLEVAGGIHAICQADLPDGAKSILLSASLGFGGLSILAQNHGMLRQLGISLRQLLCFAALRAAVSALLMAIALLPALN